MKIRLRRSARNTEAEPVRFEAPPQPPATPFSESYKVGLFEIRVSHSDGRVIYSSCFSPEVTARLQESAFALELLLKEEWIPPVRPRSLGELLYQLGARLAPMLAGRMIGQPVETAEVLAYNYVGIPSLQPFFVDDLVDELYLDSPQSTLYLDHRVHGRCDTLLYMSKRELMALQTHLEMFCGESPSLERPTIKGDVQLGGVRLRIGMDVPPLALNGESVHIRKVGASPFTLPRLVAEGTIGLGEAAFLCACLDAPVNVTIVGPSGSGKTSLLNALDIAAPRLYRRIYVEDAVESLDLAAYGFHQSKLRVPPVESELDGGARKSLEVIKSLHKTPDLLILGEIQTEEHSKALFQALSSGIKGLQTYHASGPEQAVRRWTQLHGISPVQLADLGVLVTILRPSPSSSKRYVTRVSQVNDACEVEDVFRSTPPFDSPRQMLEVALTRAAEEADRSRGAGWFEQAFGQNIANLRRAVEARAFDVGGFLEAYQKGVNPEAT